MILIKNRLNAGFFSNLNAALGWYWYSMRTDIPVYVFWDGLQNQNIFDVFFKQKHSYSHHDYEHCANLQHSSLFTDQIKDAFKEDIGDSLYDKYDGWFFCQGTAYTEPTFYKLRDLYNFIYLENLKFNENQISPMTFTKKTLGINYRFIQYYFTNDGSRTQFTQLMSTDEYNQKYIDQIESTFESGGFEHIYVASSHRLFFEKCLHKFKDKLVYIPMKRVEEFQTEYDRGNSLTDEYKTVLEDVTNLTRCHHLIISPSNLAFGTLYLNPNITFNTFKFLEQTHTS